MEERYASGFNLGSSNAQFGSREFSEQIAHLEQEGKKIIDATLTLGGMETCHQCPILVTGQCDVVVRPDLFDVYRVMCYQNIYWCKDNHLTCFTQLTRQLIFNLC